MTSVNWFGTLQESFEKSRQIFLGEKTFDIPELVKMARFGVEVHEEIVYMFL